MRAQQARNIQMLQIGDLSSELLNRILDAAIEGKGFIEIPERLTQAQHDDLVEAGYSVSYNALTGETEISWRYNGSK